MTSISAQLVSSVRQFFKLTRAHQLHLGRDRLGQQFEVDANETFQVFRETISTAVAPGEEAVLVVGFRLRLLGNNAALHWLFQRLCIVTTPFWSGFPGFHIKLWMVDPKTHNYLGIYDWADPTSATHYANTLVRILRPLSVPNSVWFKLYPGGSLLDYLHRHDWRMP